MVANQFLPFATAENAQVMTQAEYLALPARLAGFSAGRADELQVNKAIRQANFISAALAQVVANLSQVDVLDDGDLAGFVARLQLLMNGSTVVSIATLRTQFPALATIPDGTQVFVPGYYGSGTMGGGFFYYKAASVAVENGGTVIIDDAGRRWLRIVENNAWTVTMFGSKCNNTLESSTTYQAAIDYVNSIGGGALFFPGGTICVINATLYIKSNVELIGHKTTINYAQAAKTGSDRYGVRALGSLNVDSKTNLAVDVSEGLLTATPTSAAAFAAEDWILMGTTGANYYPYAGNNVDRGEVKKIRLANQDTHVLTFDDNNYDNYAVANAGFIQKIDFVNNIAVSGFTFIGENSVVGRNYGLNLTYVNEYRIAHLKFIGADRYSLSIDSSIWGTIDDASVNGVFYDGSEGSIFYAIAILNCSQWFTVINCRAEKVRHLYVNTAAGAGQGFWGQPRFGIVADCIARNMMTGGSPSYAYEHHGVGDHILIENCLADGCFSGFTVRGPGITFRNCEVVNWYRYGIYLHPDMVDASDIIIEGIKIGPRSLEGGGASDACPIYGNIPEVTNLSNLRIDRCQIQKFDKNATAILIENGSGGVVRTDPLFIRGNDISYSVALTAAPIQSSVINTVIVPGGGVANGEWVLFEESAEFVAAWLITGTLAETIAQTIVLPGNLAGANGTVRVSLHWAYSNNANSKVSRVRYGSFGSGVAGSTANTSTLTANTRQCRTSFDIINQGSVSSQIVSNNSAVSSFTTTGSEPVTMGITTTNRTEINITGTLGNIADNMTLLSYRVEVMYRGALH